MTLLLAVFMAGCGNNNNNSGPTPPPSTVTPPPAAATNPTAVDLGTAVNYVIFADAGITNTGTSAITGDMATGPGVTSAAITGFALILPPGGTFSTSAQVTGNVYAFDYADPTPTEVDTASTDKGTAYTAAAGQTASSAAHTNLGNGTLPGLTLSRGVYEWGSAVTIPTDLTLNGSATDVWIFNIVGTLDMAANMRVILTGGALPQNIFWRVSGAVTMGAGTHFEGVILGATGITFGNAASINGRLLAGTAVALDTTTVTQP